MPESQFCLLYTSDAADERSSVDLGGRRIIKKKKRVRTTSKLMICSIGGASLTYGLNSIKPTDREDSVHGVG